MLGSQANVSDANICLNTIVADAFEQLADELEGSKDFKKDVDKVIARELKAHYRIIFNHDGYGPEWETEAAKRGLLNHKNTADAVPVFYEQRNIDVFVKQGVFTAAEAVARADIRLENYTKIINIEARTMLEMAKRDIIPAVSDFIGALCQNFTAKKSVAVLPSTTEYELIKKLSALNDKTSAAVEKLEKDLAKTDKTDFRKASQHMAHVVIPDMDEVRKYADEMEKLTSSDYWPFPTYFELLYNV